MTNDFDPWLDEWTNLLNFIRWCIDNGLLIMVMLLIGVIILKIVE
jgi:hypothetical protein